MSNPDALAVAQVIRVTAVEEIMPWFRNLGPQNVREKKPGDHVTDADVAAEVRLARELEALVPGSISVGEEGAAADPTRLEALKGDSPVWLLDPIDGTGNFVGGIACFAVMVAFCRGGETEAAWIHDPVSGTTVWAAIGAGAWRDGERLRLTAPPPTGGMHGSLSSRLRYALAGRRGVDPGGLPDAIERYGCVGREYMDLAGGRLHFAQYGGRLKPWDHAPGHLIHREAGGFAALSSDGRAYHAGDGMVRGELLLAPDPEAWHALRGLFREMSLETM